MKRGDQLAYADTVSYGKRRLHDDVSRLGSKDARSEQAVTTLSDCPETRALTNWRWCITVAVRTLQAS